MRLIPLEPLPPVEISSPEGALWSGEVLAGACQGSDGCRESVRAK